MDEQIWLLYIDSVVYDRGIPRSDRPLELPQLPPELCRVVLCEVLVWQISRQLRLVDCVRLGDLVLGDLDFLVVVFGNIRVVLCLALLLEGLEPSLELLFLELRLLGGDDLVALGLCFGLLLSLGALLPWLLREKYFVKK